MLPERLDSCSDADLIACARAYAIDLQAAWATGQSAPPKVLSPAVATLLRELARRLAQNPP